MTQLTTPRTEYARAPSNLSTGTVTGAVAVLAGPTPRPDRIKTLLAERLMPPSSCSPPVHRAALPLPGDDNELYRAVTHALAQPLNPDGPSWECWVIEGLRDDRWAILTKVGGQLAEYLSPAHLLARLCDDADHGAFVDCSVAQTFSPAPGWADTIWQAAARAVEGLSAAAGALRSWPAVSTPPTVRRYRTVAVPRDAVDRIAGKFGVRPDDVALAAITEGFRAVLLHQGNPPQEARLRTVGTALAHLPVEHADPLVQLRAVHAQTGPRPADSPSALCARVFRALTRSPQQVVVLSPTPPGPRRQLQLLGRGLERLLPIPPTAPGHDTGVAVLSYDNEVVFGITTDYDATPERLAAGIESGLARLVALSRDSVVLFDRRRKRRAGALSNSAARWRPSPPPARVRH